MLGVSLRLPESADLGAALQKYITSNYTQQETTSAARGLADVQALRVKMVSSVGRGSTEHDHAQALAVCQNYYKLLSCLMARFPFQSASRPVVVPAPPSGFLNKVFSKSKVTQVSLMTTWFDAFRHSTRVQEYDIMFEKLSVLFNIAALFSRQATAIKSSVAPTGPICADNASAQVSASLKEACRLFQLSAGIFDHMSRLPEVASGALGSGMSLDLSVDSLAMLSTLMLAQSQACFFEAATTTASPKLVAKLAMGVAVLFQDAHQRCEKNARLKAIVGKPDVYPWSQHCAYQMLCYQAAGNYWFAKGALAEDDYGIEIAHLERARNILHQAKLRETGLLKNLADNRTKLESALTSRLAAAHKDNDSCYYASVPKPDKIHDPEQVQAVKPLPFSDGAGSVFGLCANPAADDPFKFLVSPFLRAQHEAVKQRVTEKQDELSKKISVAEQASKAQLDALGLPAALDAAVSASSQGGLPDDVWNRISEIQYKGGMNQLQELNTRIASAVVECTHTFEEAVAALQKEAEMDGKMRAQFSHRWNRRPSEQLTVHLQRDADSIRRFLRDADASNAKVRAELDTFAPRFELLTHDRQTLESKLPRATAEQSAATQENIAELRQLILSLTKNGADMHKLQSDFESKVAATDFLAILLNSNAAAGVSSSGSAPPVADAAANDAIFASAFEPFQSFFAAFDDGVIRQNELLDQIAAANTQFLSRRSSDDTTARRQAFLQDLNTCVSSYNKLLANLNEGLKFYSDLQAQKVMPLVQKVSDFAMARDMESKLILEQLTRQVAGFKEEDEQRAAQPASVFPAAPGSAASPPPSSGGAFVDPSVYPGTGTSSAAGAAASNPNLSFEPRSQLYNLSTPSPTSAASGPRSPVYPVHSPSPQPHQPPQPQQPLHQYTVQGMPAQHMPNPFQQQQQPHHMPPHQQHPQLAHPQPHHSYPAQLQGHTPPQSGGEWACPACTFHNKPMAHVCEICGSKR